MFLYNCRRQVYEIYNLFIYLFNSFLLRLADPYIYIIKVLCIYNIFKCVCVYTYIHKKANEY